MLRRRPSKEPTARERRAQRRALHGSDAESSPAGGDSEGNDNSAPEETSENSNDEGGGNSSGRDDNNNSGQSDDNNAGGITGDDDDDDSNERPRNNNRKVDWGRRPTFNVHPNIKVHQDIELNNPYTGGLDLSEFEDDFREIAESNGWKAKIAAMKLRKNLAGTAKRLINVYVRDQDKRTVHIDEIFSVLRARFHTRESRIDAKAVYEGIQQRKDEPVLDFVARFQKARMEAGSRDGEDAAMKFFRALTLNVDNLPFDSTRFIDVDSVANAASGLELTAKIRLKRRQRSDAQDDSEDDTPTTTNSRLEKEAKDRLKRKRLADKGGDADEADKQTKLPMHDINAFIQRLGVMVEDKVKSHLDAHTRSSAGSRSENPQSGRPLDLPLAGLGGQSGRDDHLDSTCQLCHQSGHVASNCRTLTCKRCGQWGHVANNCTWRAVCQNCFKQGHSAHECERDVQCNACGRVGHSERRCRNPQRNNSGYNQRGGRPSGRPFQQRNDSFQRDNRPRPTEICYKCRESGHYARDCTQPLPLRVTGSNAEPISNRSGAGRRGDAPHRGEPPDGIKSEQAVADRQAHDAGQGKD